MPSPKRPAVGGLPAYLLLAGAIVLAVFWKFLTFQSAYLFKDIGSDSINITYPQLRHLFDYLRTDGVPGWSFNQGLGQDIYPFSWNDPFLILLFPFRGGLLPYGFAYMEAAKLLIGGSLFYLFLLEASLSESACLAGALLFSFSGYIVLAGAWTIFSTEAVVCALTLLALERFVRRGDGRLVPIAIAFLSLLQPFLLFPYALFFAPYAAVRFLDVKGTRARGCGSFLLRFTGLAALGAAIGGALLLSDLRQMLESPRVGGAASQVRTLIGKPVFALGPVQGITALLRLFSNDLLGTGSKFRGWGNYLEAPLFYCGLAALLLAPQAFAFMDLRRRKLYGALAAFVLLPSVFPYFRYALWAFRGDYYRSLSLFFVATLLLLAMKAWSGIEKSARVDAPVLAASLGAALVVLFGVANAMNAPVDHPRRFAVAGLLAADAGLIFLMGARKSSRPARSALLILLCAEAVWSSWTTIDSRDVLTSADIAGKIGYNDFTVDALAGLKASDRSFYRVDKNYASTPAQFVGFNDAKIQGYFGTGSYAQFNQPSYIAFLAETGVIDPTIQNQTRWIRGLRSREKLMTLVGVKYFLSKSGKAVPPRFAADPLGTYGDVTVLRNRRALPLGFTHDRCMTRGEFRALDADGKDAALLDAFVVDEDSDCLGFPRFSAASVPRDDGKRYDAAIRARTADVLTISGLSQNSVAGDISLKERKLLFFSIPYDAGWAAAVDGKPEPLARVDVGFMAVPLDAGTHRVELRFAPPLRAAGTGLSLAGLGIYGFLLTRRKRRS